jgi:hypothetical protein
MEVDGASLIDEDSLVKAMRHKAAHNLDSSGTSAPSRSKSFLSFTSTLLSSKLNSVGVKLGNNDNEIFVSTNVLRGMEFDRLTVIPKALTLSDTSYLDDEEANAISDGQLLSHLVGEVSEVGLDEDRLSSLFELKASGRKSKSNSNKKILKSRK